MPYEAIDRSNLEYHSQRYNSLVQNTALAQADRVASYMLAMVWSCGVAGVGNSPHKKSYSSSTSTRLPKMTVPSHATEVLNSLTTKRLRGEYKSRSNRTERIKNEEIDGTPAHWLKNRQMRQLDIQLDCVAATYVVDTWYFAANNLVIIASDVSSTLAELGTEWAKYHVVWDPMPNMHAEIKILKYLRSREISLADVNMGVSKPCCLRCQKVLEEERVNYTSFHNTPVAENRWVAPF